MGARVGGVDEHARDVFSRGARLLKQPLDGGDALANVAVVLDEFGVACGDGPLARQPPPVDEILGPRIYRLDLGGDVLPLAQQHRRGAVAKA